MSTFKRRGLSVAHVSDIMANTGLPQIIEAQELSYEGKKGEIKNHDAYLFKTKFLGGQSIFPKFSEEERHKKIVDLDPTCI
mgnify:CR=1 FL=1